MPKLPGMFGVVGLLKNLSVRLGPLWGSAVLRNSLCSSLSSSRGVRARSRLGVLVEVRELGRLRGYGSVR